MKPFVKNWFQDFFFIGYECAWKLVYPLLRRHHRLREQFDFRLDPEGWNTDCPKGQQPATLWIQAASGGEAYLAGELLRHLALLCTGGRGIRIRATSWTRQGLDVLQSVAEELSRPDFSVHPAFFPLDAPSVMKRALDRIQPEVIVLLETELWPGLLRECALRKLPVLVLNGRMTTRSLKGYRLLPTSFWRALAPWSIAAISPEDAGRFARLFGAKRVRVVPNIKFDRATASQTRTSESAGIAAFFPPEARTILLASTRREEEPFLFPVLQELRNHCPECTLVVAPRHMHRVEAWTQELQKRGVAFVLRSQLTSPVSPGTLILWDAFGELGALYQQATAVFVGGSLAPLGGQNFLEPLALGKIPCCGPYLEHFSWALCPSGTTKQSDTLEALGLIRLCPSGASLAQALLRQLEQPLPEREVCRRFAAWLAPRKGGAETCAREIASLLYIPSPLKNETTVLRKNI